MLQLPDGFDLYLPDPFPGHLEFLPHFLEGTGTLLADAEPLPDHELFPGGKGAEDLFNVVLEIFHHHELKGRQSRLVFDEVLEDGFFFLSHWRLDGDRVAHEPEDRGYLVDRHP